MDVQDFWLQVLSRPVSSARKLDPVSRKASFTVFPVGIQILVGTKIRTHTILVKSRVRIATTPLSVRADEATSRLYGFNRRSRRLPLQRNVLPVSGFCDAGTVQHICRRGNATLFTTTREQVSTPHPHPATSPLSHTAHLSHPQ